MSRPDSAGSRAAMVNRNQRLPYGGEKILISLRLIAHTTVIDRALPIHYWIRTVSGSRDGLRTSRLAKGLHDATRENRSASLIRARCLSDFVFAERK